MYRYVGVVEGDESEKAGLELFHVKCFGCVCARGAL